MRSYGHILVHKREIKVLKITNLVCSVPKPYLIMAKAHIFSLNQNDCWFKIIKGEKRVQNLGWGAAMMTKIVREKKHLKIY